MGVGVKKVFAKRNTRVFLLWYLCFVLAAGTVVTASQYQNIARERQAYAASLAADTGRLLEYFSHNFRAAVDSAGSVFLSRWYKHYRNVADLYAEEFDGMRRIEIQEDLRSRLTSMAYVSDILVITPPPLGTIITPNGWFSFADYEKIYGMVTVDYHGDYTRTPEVTVQSEGLCVITLQDSTPRKWQGILCLLIDRKAFGSMFARMLPDHVVHAQVMLADQLLYESGEAADGLATNAAAMSDLGLSLRLSSTPYHTALLPERLTYYAMMMALVLFVSALLSATLTWLFHKPLRGLLEKVGASSHGVDDPYQFIERYIESYSAANARLRMEKETQDRTMSQLVTLMHNEILFGMVTNPQMDYQNAHVRSCVPWLGEGLPLVLVLVKQRPEGAAGPLSEAPYAALSQEALHACLFPVFYGDLCMILWYADESAARVHREALPQRLAECAEGPCDHAISDLLLEPGQLSGSYALLVSALARKQGQSLSLPLSAQIRLINLLHEGKADAAGAALCEMRAEAALAPDALLRFLLGVALEYKMDARAFADAYQRCSRTGDADGQWAALEALARALCSAIATLRDEGMNQTAETIRRYIDEHFADPSLGMQTLTDVFHMHRSFLSRMLKSHLGVTFSDYLQALRINRAMEMMQDADMSITAIAEAVGYTNYITFKRAFTRYHGVTPSVYRTQ